MSSGCSQVYKIKSVERRGLFDGQHKPKLDCGFAIVSRDCTWELEADSEMDRCVPRLLASAVPCRERWILALTALIAYQRSIKLEVRT